MEVIKKQRTRSLNIRFVLNQIKGEEIWYKANYNGQTITALRKLAGETKKNLLKVDKPLISSLGFDDIEQLRERICKIQFARKNNRNAVLDLTLVLKI